MCRRSPRGCWTISASWWGPRASRPSGRFSSGPRPSRSTISRMAGSRRSWTKPSGGIPGWRWPARTAKAWHWARRSRRERRAAARVAATGAGSRVSTPLRVGTRGSALALWQTEHVRARLQAAGTPPCGSRSAPPATWCSMCPSPRSAAGHCSPSRSTTRCSKAGSISPCTRSRTCRRRSRRDRAGSGGRARGSAGRAGGPRAARVERPAPWRGAWPPAASGAGRSSSTCGPTLEVRDIRGNVDTRLAKLDAHAEWTGILLAAAGLVRLGFADGSASGCRPS